jgi:hypothetical protein
MAAGANVEGVGFAGGSNEAQALVGSASVSRSRATARAKLPSRSAASMCSLDDVRLLRWWCCGSGVPPTPVVYAVWVARWSMAEVVPLRLGGGYGAGSSSRSSAVLCDFLARVGCGQSGGGYLLNKDGLALLIFECQVIDMLHVGLLDLNADEFRSFSRRFPPIGTWRSVCASPLSSSNKAS